MGNTGSTKVRAPKTVPVTVNTDGSCSPDPVHAYPSDHIIWSGACAEVHFPANNPFDMEQSKKFPANKKHQVAKPPGKYTYNVTTASGTYDPDVIIDPPQ
jgi:hypothetical protein